MPREFKDYENENGGIVSAHVVTEETQGDVSGVDGRAINANVGTVLLATSRPDVFDVGDAKSFNSVYTERKSVTHSHDDLGEHTHDETPDSNDEAFDPSAHTAAEVKAYLAENRGSEEYARVSNAERSGLNRAAALR